MYRFNLSISKLACFVCIFALLGGCDNQAEQPKATNVVSKKIVAKQQPAPAKPAPAPAPAAQPTEPPAQPAPQPTGEESTPRSIVQLVKQAATPEARAKADKSAAPEKPAAPAAPAPAAPEKASAAPPEAVPAAADAGEKKPVTVSYLLTGIYDPTGKIDPFLPLYKEEPVTKAKETEKKKKIRRLPLTPLEKVDLSQLKLVGIIRAPSGNRALVEEATGKGYIVKQGTYIGINAGRVVDILSDRLIVEEEVETALGSYELQKRELKIQKPPGEM